MAVEALDEPEDFELFEELSDEPLDLSLLLSLEAEPESDEDVDELVSEPFELDEVLAAFFPLRLSVL